jgi:hypothetical protein
MEFTSEARLGVESAVGRTVGTAKSGVQLEALFCREEVGAMRACCSRA